MNLGEAFLHRKDPQLHTTEPVEYEQKRKKRTGEKPTQKPAAKLADWLAVLEQTHGHTANPQVMERLKDYYHRQYVIGPKNVPEAAFLLEQRIARELGFGDIELTDEYRQQKTNEIIHNQEASLDRWLNYLTSPDATYPTWAKYWAFTAMVKMGKFNKEKEEFEKRAKDTAAPFPMLNPRALAKTIEAIQVKLNQDTKPKAERGELENLSKQLSRPEFTALASTESFAKLYAQFLKEIPEYSTEGLQETRGHWVKYPQGSEPDALVESLEGYPLEWCTASPETAKTQLQGGDFYVYYSINQDGDPVIPRAAIRMDGDSIAEVRGIAPNQNVDPYIAPVIQEKMKEFPDGPAYEKKAADMKRLTELEQKTTAGTALTKEELVFLYEIDYSIQGFGYQRDPRIKEIIAGRDLKTDLSQATGLVPEAISTNQEEVLQGGRQYHYGNLDFLGYQSADGLTLPKAVSGYLDLRSLQSAKGLTLPQAVGGALYLKSLESAVGLTLPKTVRGYLDLRSLQSAAGLTFPETVGDSLDLHTLQSAEGLTLPQSVGGGLDLSNLQSADGLILPKTVGGSIHFGSLKSAVGLTFPETVGDSIFLHTLQSAKQVTLPKTVGGALLLSKLQSAEELTLPQTVGDGLDLANLGSTDGLTLPKTVGGKIDFDSLRSAKKLILPEHVSGDVNLSNLQSVAELILPKTVGGNLYLNTLQSAEELTLPETVGGDLDLGNFQSAEGLTLPKTVGGYLNLFSLQSVEGLILPETVGGGLNLHTLQSANELTLPKSSIRGSIDFDSLQSVEKLVFPEHVSGDVDLSDLQSAVGLTLPKTVDGNLYLSNLKSADGLSLPETVGGRLDLSDLQTAAGLKLPRTVRGDLDLGSLESAAGMIFPETVGGYVRLASLQSAVGLKLPETVGDYLNLYSLRSVDGLTWPQTVGGWVDLHRLKSTAGLTLPQNVGDRILFGSAITSEEARVVQEKFPHLDIPLPL